MPLNTPWPSCSMVDVLPCIGTPARTTAPPNTAPIAWWPRHTPRIGVVSPRRRITPIVTPARSGRDHNALRRGVDDVFHRHRVVAHHLHVRPELAQVLHEVVGERVVVV